MKIPQRRPILQLDTNPDAHHRIVHTGAQQQHPISPITDLHVEFHYYRERTDDPTSLDRQHDAPKLQHTHLRERRAQ